MECLICNWSPEDPDYRYIYETQLWRVVLAPNQNLLGRCVVHLKRHSGDLADLAQDELIEWLAVIQSMEAALQTAFDATMFNWSCYMNHAYCNRPPNPHIHWWVVPRYDHAFTISDWKFEDPLFGDPYDHNKWVAVPKDLHQEIAERIKHAISN